MSETPVITRSTTWSPGLAAVMSAFFPGLGQIYKGRIGRGILIFIGQVCMWFIGVILLFLPTLAFWIWNIYDAYKGPHASELKA